MNSRRRSVKPFVKWAGGKSQIADLIENLLPGTYNNYHEPFVGGGAVFFHLCKISQIPSDNNSRKNKVILNDKIYDLITTYRVVKKEVESLIKELSNGNYENTRSRFEEIRKWEPTDNVEKAARLIYLNKTCYNGLWRVNQEGKFNVPHANNLKAKILDELNLRAVSAALKNVSLYHWDYKKAIKRAQSGDFLYLDPPYYTEHEPNFTGYTVDRFSRDDQVAFAEECAKLDKLKCKVLISNSEDPFTLELFRSMDFNIQPIRTKRMISCKVDGRTRGRELLIWNYESDQSILS